jgi:CubicO group peptidase (beta-lactamase class C family)
MAFDDAITYAERHTLHALLVAVDGRIVITRSAVGEPHALYSGTKSFWGITAAAAQDDGLLALDEPAAATLPEWRADPLKAAVTIRELLSLTSGHGFGGLGNAVPIPERAVAIPLKNAPGTVFTYGGIPLQVFGEIMRRKLAPRYPSPQAYLQARVLDRIGATVARWRTLADGTQTLPTGAFVLASEWLKFGQLLLARGAGVVSEAGFDACVTGSACNAKYGLGLWLDVRGDAPHPVYASGAGGQGLYVIPRQRIVAVHFGHSSGWNHATFLGRLAAE